jgi:hypothetical protein
MIGTRSTSYSCYVFPLTYLDAQLTKKVAMRHDRGQKADCRRKHEVGLR